MKATNLISKELKVKFAKMGDQSEVSDPIVLAKFFNPCGSQTWYAISYDADTNICFGYVTGMFEDEYGTFSIDELESLKLPFGLRIERDIYFIPCRISDIVKEPS